MSLINYIEPVNAGNILLGFGGMVLTLVMCWVFYRIFKPMIGWLETAYNRETKYEIVESKLLSDYAMEKGIDLDKEMIKRDIISKKRPSIRNRIEEEMFKKMFPEDDKPKK